MNNSNAEVLLEKKRNIILDYMHSSYLEYKESVDKYVIKEINIMIETLEDRGMLPFTDIELKTYDELKEESSNTYRNICADDKKYLESLYGLPNYTINDKGEMASFEERVDIYSRFILCYRESSVLHDIILS